MTRFIGTEEGQRLYGMARDLPIVDYHCHLSPREIREDPAFSDPGQLWLAGDHYKWRLMRQAGVPEEFITGAAPWREKFRRFLGALELAAGCPLYHWCALELERYFGIDLPLTAANADGIYDRAAEVLRAESFSPRTLIRRSGVEFIATTDDPADPLDHHLALAADPSFSVRVTPSFRTDRMLTVSAPDYRDYLTRLGQAADVEIRDLDDFRRAVGRRLDDFVAAGCRMTDVGISRFPDRVGTDREADGVLRRALAGKAPDPEEESAFLGNCYRFLGGAYRERNLVMQWHLGPLRNVNAGIFQSLGGDAGCDVAGDPVPMARLAGILDGIDRDGGLPRTILYALRPDMAHPIGVLCGAFRNVTPGAAWWFCDTKSGIVDQLKVAAETGCLGRFPGMLTDSRSFLSYARHDYYRRLVCDYVGGMAEAGEFHRDMAEILIRKLCYENAREMVEEKR